jgi:hypothetical protein
VLPALISFLAASRVVLRPSLQPGKTRFTIDDGSGRISLTLFFTEGEDLTWSETRAQLQK